MGTTVWTQVLVVLVTIVGAVVLASYTMLLMVKNMLLFHPHTLAHDMSLSNVPPEISYTRVPCLGGNELAVYYRTDPDYSLPFVLYSHGNADIVELGASWMRDSLRVMNIIAYDYRGYGRSDGVPSEYTLEMDLLYLVSWMKKTFPTINIVDDVVLWGRSIGTYVTLTCIQDERRQPFLPNRVFLFTPFARLSDVFHNMGMPLSRLAWVVGNMDVSKALKTYCAYNFDRRVLIMASRCDTITPFTNAEELAKSVDDQAQITFKEFYDLHGCWFTYWDEFAAFDLAYRTNRHATPRSIPCDEYLDGIAALFVEDEA